MYTVFHKPRQNILALAPTCGVIGTFGEIERSREVLRYHRR